MTWPERVMFISVDLNACTVFSSLYPKLLLNNNWRSFITWNDLGENEEGSLVAIFRYMVSSLPVTRCKRVFRMVFVQMFSHYTYNGEFTKLTGPYVTGMKIPRWHFIDAVTHSNRWKFRGDRSVDVAMTSIQTFSEVRSFADLTFSDLGLKFLHVRKIYEHLCQKLWRKPRGGIWGSDTLGPAWVNW